ncbi:MAG: TonB-dependent receptor [Pseudomonadota bacterium]|nr:TonB-dependent receptor [Pseudomonadota bacterium]
MHSRKLRVGTRLLVALMLIPAATSLFAAEGRQIEEIVVTAERRESTVQDTAISITAFTGEFIEDFGLRNQEDLQNYIPATTIQPYDLSIRGVGRLYRALGGDPGIATYFDGAYSEDFGIASTEAGLFDLERIEVLRGPQGTLYGRNGLGGAVNFHSKKPTDEFEGEIKTIWGSYNTKEIFGVLSGPIVDGLLNARVTGVKRSREGFVEEFGTGPDLNSYGDENYALTLEFTPSDTLSILIRGNERSYRREMSGAQGAGAVIVSEMGGIPDPVTGGKRWSSLPVLGWRQTYDPSDAGAVMCASAIDRTDPMCLVPTGIIPYINDTSQGSIAGTGVYRFESNGIVRFGQPIMGGVDVLPADATHWQNWTYQANGDADAINILNRTTLGNGRELPEMDGDDLVTYTNGHNDEFFDHQAAYASVTWDVKDNFTMKYIGAYTDYYYDRTTEHDRTGLPHDMQFFAAQENENYQHELQFFYDFSENLTLTAGLFAYENDIDQQLDFYSPDSWSKFSQSDDQCGGCYYGGLGSGTWGLGGPIHHRSAQMNANPTPGAGPGGVQTHFGLALGGWHGDNVHNTGQVDHGPVSDGTTFIWDTENRSSAQAIYAQTEWQINDTWAITLGARWAEDEKEGEENLYLYREGLLFGTDLKGVCVAVSGDSVACGDDPVNPDGVVTLAEYNQNVTGALDADGNVVNFDTLRKNGVPWTLGLYRRFERTFDDLTYRVNIDFTPTDDALVYLSVTTGYRAGGFNLGFFAPTPTYDNEEITAFELGYKGQLADGTVQINASTYLYDYNDISLQFLESSVVGEGTSVTNAPGAQTYGAEVDILWLATDNLTIGFNYSFTHAEYDGELPVDKMVVDTSNPWAPTELFTSQERKVPIDGEPLPRIPETKWTAWAEYQHALGENGKLVFLTVLNYTDEFPAAGRPLPSGPLVTAPDFMRWDARISWLSADEQWNVTGFINNILDEVGTRNMFTYSSQGGYRRGVEPTNPRMAGIEIQYKFGAFQ